MHGYDLIIGDKWINSDVSGTNDELGIKSFTKGETMLGLKCKQNIKV